MRCRLWGAALLVVAVATPGWTGEGKSKRPRLEMRTTRSLSLPPVQIVAVAELVGGEDLEAYYCAGLEWDWGDGTKSYHESDCAPWEPGADVDRFFSARHVYGAAGSYRVRIRLRRAERDVASAAAVVQVGGLMASRWEE